MQGNDWNEAWDAGARKAREQALAAISDRIGLMDRTMTRRAAALATAMGETSDTDIAHLAGDLAGFAERKDELLRMRAAILEQESKETR